VLAIVPIALSITVLAVDVSGFQSLRERAQKEADRIALQAVKALPDQELALEIIRRNADSLEDLEIARGDSGEEIIVLDAESVSLALAGSQEALFDTFLPQAQLFAVREFSTAARVPQDLVVVFADGHTLRPPARAAWGNDLDWPASKYFNFVSNPRPQGVPLPPDTGEGVYWPSWWNDWNSDTYRRWATQSCFNPVYSSLKLAAIGLLDRLSAFSNTRVGLVFTPGDDAQIGYAVSRRVSLTASRGAEARWFRSMELETFFGDETCLLFSHPDTSAEDRYQLPARSLRSPSTRSAEATCPSIFRSNGWGAVWYPNGHLEDCFSSDSLSLREALYYRASRSTELSKDGSHILAALEQAMIQLGAGPSAEEQAARGSLAISPQRRILLFTDILPQRDVPGLAEVVNQIEALNAELIIVSFHHSGLSEERASLLEEAEGGIRELDSGTIKLTSVRSVEELLSTELFEFFQRGEEYVLRR